MVKDDPTTLYIYPDAADVAAVSRAKGRAEVYWNASCLRQIKAPRYWSEQTLGPLLARYRSLHPPPPPHAPPLCRGQ